MHVFYVYIMMHVFNVYIMMHVFYVYIMMHVFYVYIMTVLLWRQSDALMKSANRRKHTEKCSCQKLLICAVGQYIIHIYKSRPVHNTHLQ